MAVRGIYAGRCQYAVSVARCVQLHGAFFASCSGTRLSKRACPYSGNNGQPAKKFSAGGGKSGGADLWRKLVAQLSWLAALLCGFRTLKKRMYVTYIRFLHELPHCRAECAHGAAFVQC